MIVSPFGFADTATDVVKGVDLTGLASVSAFATAWQGPLGILINNAGVMASPV